MAKLSTSSFTFALLFFYLSTLVLGQGTQFITGACSSDADCASGCCGFNSGKCAGPVVAQERDGGCGFGDSSPNDDAAVALGFTGVGAPGTNSGSSVASSDDNDTSTNNTVSSSSSSNSTDSDDSAGDFSSSARATRTSAAASAATSSSGSGMGAGTSTGNGAQFITGPCSSDADCASGCCGFNSGKCAGPVVAQERDGGCGFGDGVPNDDAAQAFRNSEKRWVEYDYRGE